MRNVSIPPSVFIMSIPNPNFSLYGQKITSQDASDMPKELLHPLWPGVLADLQIMVFLAFLVTRKYLSRQKMLSKSTPFCWNCKNFLWFSSTSYRILEHFLPNYQIWSKRGNIFSQIIWDIWSKALYFAENFCKFR